MKRLIRHGDKEPGTEPGKAAGSGFEGDLLLNSDDSILHGMIEEYLKGRLDIEDVINDPSLQGTENLVNEMISDHYKNNTRNSDTEKFIRDALKAETSDRKLREEISQIKHEIGYNDINEASERMVKEWNGRRHDYHKRAPGTEEIRDFIVSSLKPAQEEPETRIPIRLDERRTGTPFRYMSLAAAAVIGVFIVVRTLIPSFGNERLFNKYYEPLKAVSLVTREYGSSVSGSYASAIEKYKIGDYQGAATGLTEVLRDNNSTTSPRFLMGITQLALGNYGQTIDLLSDTAVRSGEYGKEAEWYLGLAYLKTGETEKALECFELLVQTSGFYRERAEKMIRRLK